LKSQKQSSVLKIRNSHVCTHLQNLRSRTAFFFCWSTKNRSRKNVIFIICFRVKSYSSFAFVSNKIVHVRECMHFQHGQTKLNTLPPLQMLAYVYSYVYIYDHIYTYISIYIYLQIYACLHCICMHIHTRIIMYYIHIYIFIVRLTSNRCTTMLCIHSAHTHPRTHPHTHPHTNAQVHAHWHAHTCTRYTYPQSRDTPSKQASNIHTNDHSNQQQESYI